MRAKANEQNWISAIGLILLLASPRLAAQESQAGTDEKKQAYTNDVDSKGNVNPPQNRSNNTATSQQIALGRSFVPNARSYGGSATLSNAVGIGSFVSGYGKVPSWSSSLTLTPFYQMPSFWGLPKMMLSASGSLSWRWLDSYTTSTFSANNRFTYSDVSLSLDAFNIVHFESLGFSISPSLGLTAPISQPSRALNRLLSLGASTNVNWSHSDFIVSWTPSFSGWLHSGPAMTSPCNERGTGRGLPPVINPQNPNFDLDQYMQELVTYRSEESRDGTCIVAGRQTLGMLSNSASFSWTPGRHVVSAGLGWFINFLRPLTDRPDLRSDHASPQGFTEATMGRIAYSYSIPVDFNLVVSGGVLSYQASFNKQANLAFPFFDFVTPGKNQTQFFIQLTAGI